MGIDVMPKENQLRVLDTGLFSMFKVFMCEEFANLYG